MPSVRIPRVPTYSGFRSTSPRFHLRDYHPLRSVFQDGSVTVSSIFLRSLPRRYFYPRFGLLRFRSPLLSESFLLSFPPGTKMFQFPGFASITYVFSYGYRNVTSGGFPHSDINGSTLACSFPLLFAAYHVLRRLLVPRHPPYALYSLTFHRLYV